MSEQVIPLNPGIRRWVKLLNDRGFDTLDSGDGETHACESDRPYGYVVIYVPASELLLESSRLYAFLTFDMGLKVGEVGSGSIAIQGTFDPANHMATIELLDVHDRMLPTEN